MSHPLAPATYADQRDKARRFLPRQLFDYIDGGSYNEVTLRNNSQDLDRLCINQRVLRDVSRITTSTRILGQDWSMPVALAPVGLAGLFRRCGEIQAAHAAQAFGIPFTLSMMGLCSIEEVAKNSAKPFWFQLYMMRDRGFVMELVERAEKVGCSALVVTVDLPYTGVRYRDVRNGLVGGLGLSDNIRVIIDRMQKLGWLRDVVLSGRPLTLGTIAHKLPPAGLFPDFVKFAHSNFDPSVTWKDIEWIRARWKGALIIKGVMDEEDARLAADVGAQSVVVSNHGGRQLDSVSSSIAALPAIATAVGDRVDVLIDGGIRSGLDVIKAVALGAKGCLLGRAWAYPLAANGEAGVKSMLRTMHSEIRVAMALSGATSISEIK